MIATSMSAEVCSTYIMRAGDILELFATEGLFPESVHRTRLRVGEGLVGVIAATARPLALADAQGHPAFAYRPETGEEIFHSLMGVPILRAGRVTGVLVVQNRSPRDYGDEEVEVLQTVAMVLAELVAGGELVERDEQHPTDGIAMLPHRLDGIRLHNGLGVGPNWSRKTPRPNCAAWTPRLPICARRSTGCSPRASSAMAAITARSWRHTVCSPRIAAGSAAFAKRSTAG
jgi:phosphotransferase system enzyme I (PtsP)